MIPTEIGEAIARLLLQAGAIKVSRGQPFILAAGWASPVYVDCRLLIGTPELRQAATALAAAAVETLFPAGRIQAIAGAETAGIPFAAWLADRLGLPLRYVRKRPLGIGHNAQVEGGPVDGLDVLLMDDLTTDAGSKVAFARGLRAAGARVGDALTIFYHSAFPGAAERLQQEGLRLHALATWDDVMRADRGEWLSPDERREITTFLADPIAWSTRHGGRSSLPSRQPLRRDGS
jgi:orotate phosphoribosyltransferase